jgi:arylsulfate sulfotransferase
MNFNTLFALILVILGSGLMSTFLIYVLNYRNLRIHQIFSIFFVVEILNLSLTSFLIFIFYQGSIRFDAFQNDNVLLVNLTLLLLPGSVFIGFVLTLINQLFNLKVKVNFRSFKQIVFSVMFLLSLMIYFISINNINNIALYDSIETFALRIFRGIEKDSVNMGKMLQKQSDIDSQLNQVIESGLYSLEIPLVIVNPYGNSPLSALIIFTSEVPMRPSVQIRGKDEVSDVSHHDDEFRLQHTIPIYGLYADYENEITLTMIDENANEIVKNIYIETEPLPLEIQNLYRRVHSAYPSQYQEGFTFTVRSHLNYKLAFDIDGEIRWLLEGDFKSYLLFINDDNFYTVYKNYLVEMNLLGRINKVIYVDEKYGSLHHDIEILSTNSNSILMLANSPNSNMIEDFIIEVNLTTGEVVNEFDLKTIIDLNRTLFNFLNKDLDPFHTNAIVSLKDSNDVLISNRHTSNVMRFSWPDGDVKWIAGNPLDASPISRHLYLQPMGEDFEYFYSQHAPFELEDIDNDPNTIDILIFDNGNARVNAYCNNNLQCIEENTEDLEYSRLVHYRINELTMTIEQIRDFGKEFGRGLYAPSTGDLDVLNNGNWLGTFNTFIDNKSITRQANYVEINSNNEIVWSMQIFDVISGAPFGEYRSERRKIYQNSSLNLKLEEVILLNF